MPQDALSQKVNELRDRLLSQRRERDERLERGRECRPAARESGGIPAPVTPQSRKPESEEKKGDEDGMNELRTLLDQATAHQDQRHEAAGDRSQGHSSSPTLLEIAREKEPKDR